VKKNKNYPLFIAVLAMAFLLGCRHTAVVSPLTPVDTLPKKDDIFSMALSPDNRYLAIGGTRKVLLWDMLLKKERQVFEGGAGDILSLAFSADGKTLAAGGFKTVTLWDIDGGQAIAFSDHADYITSLAFSPDSLLLAAGSRGTESAIYLWNVRDKTLIQRMTPRAQYANQIRALAFSPDGNQLASLGLHAIHLWDMEKGDMKKESEGVPFSMDGSDFSTPLAMALRPGQKQIAIGTADGRVMLHDLSNNERTAMGSHQGAVLYLAFTQDGKGLISLGEDQTVRQWDVETQKVMASHRLNTPSTFTGMIANGNVVATMGREGVDLFSLEPVIGIPPVIAILTPTDQQEVAMPSVRLTGKIADDTGIQEVVIWVNGVEWKRRSMERNIRTISLDEALSLKAGANSVVIRAEDSDGLSQTQQLKVTYQGGKVFVVVIGISQYQQIGGLRYADRDAAEIYKYMTVVNKIPKDQIWMLTNENATLARIKDVLGVEVMEKAQKQDTVLIFFAGHGAPWSNRNSPDGDGLEKYLLPYDTDLNRLYSTGFPMREFSELFPRYSAERVVLLLDSCFSGASHPAHENEPNGGQGRTVQTALFKAPIAETFIDRLTRGSGKGRVVLTASQANEVSIERDDMKHGVFTYYLLEAFQKGDTDGDGWITIGEAYRYVSKMVPGATRQFQNPMKTGSEVGEEIVLGKVGIEE
jgi:hypothetical protein